jgi:hypothetical protein
MARAAIPPAGDFAVIATSFTAGVLAVLAAAVSDQPRWVTFLHWDYSLNGFIPQAILTACLHG